jgi:hypothetical protein
MGSELVLHNPSSLEVIGYIVGTVILVMMILWLVGSVIVYGSHWYYKVRGKV